MCSRRAVETRQWPRNFADARLSHSWQGPSRGLWTVSLYLATKLYENKTVGVAMCFSVECEETCTVVGLIWDLTDISQGTGRKSIQCKLDVTSNRSISVSLV